MSRITLIVAAGLMLLGSTGARAATVTYTLSIDDAGPGTFSLFAEASAGDNAGLATFGVPLTGDLTSADNLTLFGLGQTATASGLAGFSSLRSSDGSTAVRGAQDTITPSPFIYFGVGQTAGTAATSPTNGPITFIPLDMTQILAYSAMYQLAAGTYDTNGSRPGFNTASPDLLANVFTGNGLAVEAATIVTQIIPEPASLALLLFGTPLLLRRSCAIR